MIDRSLKNGFFVGESGLGRRRRGKGSQDRTNYSYLSSVTRETGRSDERNANGPIVLASLVRFSKRFMIQ